MKTAELLLEKITEIEAESFSAKDDPDTLERYKDDIAALEIQYYRAKADDPNLETSDAFACINWLGEYGTVDDLDRLMRVLRRFASCDTQNIIPSIYAAIKRIFERDMKEIKKSRTKSSPESEVSEARAKEIMKMIQSYATEVLGDDNRANAWLNAPMPSLSYQTPISLLKTESGEKKVRNLLHCINYGVYS